MYTKVLNQFQEISQRLDNHNISSIVNRAEETLAADHKFNVTIVSNYAGCAELFKIADDLSGMETACSYINNLTGKNFQLIFRYGEIQSRAAIIDGETLELTEDNEDDVFDEVDSIKIIHTLSNSFLKKTDITLCNEIHKKDIWQEIFENTDFLLLSTNATMALPLEERNWIDSYVLPFFSGERFSVIVNNSGILNSDEDREAMFEFVENYLDKLDEKIEFYKESVSITERINYMLENQEHAKTLRIKNILNNLFANFKELVEDLLNSADINISTSAKAIKQLESNRKELEAAGRVTAENMVKNIYSDFKFKAIESIENYSDSAKNSILKKVEKSNDIEALSQDIEPYLKSVWKTYEIHFSKKISQAREYAVERLIKQVEMDTDRIINNLDAETVELIEKAIHGADTWKTPDFYGMGVGENSREDFVKKTVKGIMLTSVPLFFVNPVYGIVTLIGSQIYKRSQKSSILEEEKRLVSESVEKYCEELKKIITVSIIDGLDNEADECRSNIKIAYASLIDLLIKEIQSYSAKMEVVREKRIILEEALNKGLNDMINEL